MKSGKILFSSDRSEFDLTKIVRAVQSTKWGCHRSEEKILNSIERSICMVAKVGTEQIGFVSAVSDGEFLGYISDIIISEQFHRQQFGSRLIGELIHQNSLCEVETWMLRTLDAHKFFEKLGFSLAPSGRLMTARKKQLLEKLSVVSGQLYTEHNEELSHIAKQFSNCRLPAGQMR